MLVVTLGCAVLAWRIEPEIRQREAVKALRAKGGQFAYIVDEDDATYIYAEQYVAYDYELKAPKWPPIILDLSDKPVGRDELQMISRLTSLQLLDMSSHRVAFSEEDLSALYRLSNLNNLLLPYGKVSRKTVSELKIALPHCTVTEW
ncbi:MAG TPA: hypothetical protein VF306_22100 [Pirellulales bacterium]